MQAFGYRSLAVGLSRVLFPIVVLLGLTGIVVGILNSYEHFTVPALTPVFWNVAIIAGLADRRPARAQNDRELYVYAFSILVATRDPVPAADPVAARPRRPAARRDRLARPGGAPDVRADGPDHARARADQLQRASSTRFFAARLIDKYHAPSSINAAFRLYMLPQGMFSVAVATVLFPSLARLASRADLDGFRTTVATGIRQIAFLLVPASVVCAVLAEPIVRRRLPARRLHLRPDAGDRRRARGLLARARLQRRSC